MSKQLIIAEKPSVAADLARVLGKKYGKLKKDESSALQVKVETIDNYGFTYAVGSAGNVTTGAKMVTVRVIKNKATA